MDLCDNNQMSLKVLPSQEAKQAAAIEQGIRQRERWSPYQDNGG